MKFRRNILILLFAAVLVMQALPGQMFIFAGNDGETQGTVKIDLDVSDLPDSDELFAGYVRNVFSAEDAADKAMTFKRNAANYVLTSTKEKEVYDHFEREIKKIAEGTRTDTKIEFPKLAWTYSELGIDGSDKAALYKNVDKKLDEDINVNRLLYGIMADFPYHLYWYDKTKQHEHPDISMNAKIKDFGDGTAGVEGMCLNMPVAEQYRKGSEVFTTDENKTGAASKAVESAKQIVAEHEGKSDLEKLRVYSDKIRELVTYNTGALGGSTPYGDPWQVIYVFDGDPNTNVVCEGYSKAFQYLCDLSKFKSEVKCYTTTGKSYAGGSGAEKGEHHMWNVVGIYGGNYMVDVTNCDEGVGAPDKLFLVGVKGTDGGSTHTFDVGGVLLTYKYSALEKDSVCTGYLELTPGRPSEPAAPEPEPEPLSFKADEGYDIPAGNKGAEARAAKAFTATGGKEPYQFSVVGTVDGLTVDNGFLVYKRPAVKDETTAKIQVKDAEGKTAEINVRIGAVTEKPVVPGKVDASVNPTTATFDIYAESPDNKDLTFVLSPGSYELKSITLNGIALTKDSDYTVTGGEYTIKKSLLSNKAMQGEKVLTFNMSGGNNPTVTLTIKDTTAAEPPAEPPASPEYKIVTVTPKEWIKDSSGTLVLDTNIPVGQVKELRIWAGAMSSPSQGKEPYSSIDTANYTIEDNGAGNAKITIKSKYINGMEPNNYVIGAVTKDDKVFSCEFKLSSKGSDAGAQPSNPEGVKADGAQKENAGYPKTSDHSHIFLYVLALIGTLATGFVMHDELKQKRT